jgi:(2R)-sulfolactate sulfo-lyase subunit alpha
MAHSFLVHEPGDSVGVAVDDLAAGARTTGKTLRGERAFEVTLRDAVPLGHKVALVAMKPGDRVIEYGEVIGQATAEIPPGAHVHVHNINSVRWPRSTSAAEAKVA